MARRIGAVAKRSLILVHRWLGVALCLIFLLWFPSGIAMMYWDYPSVTDADRVERAPAIDRSRIRLSPAEAYEKAGFTEPRMQVRLGTFDGRPVYRFRDADFESVVYADTGEEQLTVSPEMIQRVAESWVGRSAGTARVDEMSDVDQWTLSGFRDLRPLWKYSWPEGDQVYVSGVTGEVVQFTTTGSRIGAYLGAIPHWLYFTPLRKNGQQWSRLVIWSSGIGTVAALLGLVIGVWMYAPDRRYRRAGAATSIPYRGQKRWHTLLGLVFGLGAATWAFSGMLSMDPFPTLTGGPNGGRRGPRTGAIPEALRPVLPIQTYAARDPRDVLAALPDRAVKELEFTAFAGEPVYLATLAGGETRVVPFSGAPRAAFDRQRVIDVVTRAAQPSGLLQIGVLDQYDWYYLDRRRDRPLPVILAQTNDAEKTRYYIDPATARVVSTYRTGNWVNRWLYHGLHSLDIPWLYNHRPLWDIVVIAFMLGGTALCVTSLVLAWRVVGRTLVRVRPGGRRSGYGLGGRQPIRAD